MMNTDEKDGNATPPDTSQEKLWEHPYPKSTKMWEFLKVVNIKHNLEIKNYEQLYKWSVTNVSKFWEEVFRFVGVKASQSFSIVSKRLSDNINSFLTTLDRLLMSLS